MNIIRVFMITLICLLSAGICVFAEENDDSDIYNFTDESMPEDFPGGNEALNPITPARVVTGNEAKNCNTELVLIGTTGGISWHPESDRASSSSVLIVDDSWYIIDMGHGSAARLSEALNYGNFEDTPQGRVENGSSTFLEHANALFFTHLHQDHTADYPSFLLIGAGAGLGTKRDPSSGKVVYVPLKVIGPADRGKLEADNKFYGKRRTGYLYR
ncbi:MAG: hypothetical protein GXY48_08215 [Methanomicrobiales archaeon]|nr:hypothetical protein [Methanomicrobiales archaeon]